MAKKWVYLLEESNVDRDLLGGKGAGLSEMTQIGLPIPPGFTITTEAWKAYYAAGKEFPEGLWEQTLTALKELEERTSKKFGDSQNPLLVSARSGAKLSMPGMLDTVLNLGLNEETLQGLIQLTGNPRFAYDAYRRLIQMFGKIVFHIAPANFEKVLDYYREKKGAKLDTELTAEDLKEITEKFKAIVSREAGINFPGDPYQQLQMAIRAIFESWNSKRAIAYRDFHNIPHDLGTAATVQTMVFGNMGLDSGTGVAFTRDPRNGDKVIYGEYLLNAQGEDVVASSIRIPKPLQELKNKLPAAYDELIETCERLERHYREAQDVEFSIEKGKLWILQTRAAKLAPQAAMKIAVDMVEEGLITSKEAVQRVRPSEIDRLRYPRFDPEAKEEAVASGRFLAKGLGASSGAALGRAVFDADTAERWGLGGKPVILVRPETNPDDVHGMLKAKGILTSRGGVTSHMVLVARNLNKPCVVGCDALKIELGTKSFSVNDKVIREGDFISIDGGTGEVFLGQLLTQEPEHEGQPELVKLLSWAQRLHEPSAWANADYRDDAEMAHEFAARAEDLWQNSPWVTDKAKLAEVLKLIPHSERILEVPVSAQNRERLRKTMLDVIERGYWVGLRTCYAIQPLGTAEWRMGIRSPEMVQQFLTHDYPMWLEDPGLREIIVLYNPQELGLPEFEDRHFVFRVACHLDQVIVEMNLYTAQLRSIEKGTAAKDLIHIVRSLNPEVLSNLGKPWTFSFGGKYLVGGKPDAKALKITEAVAETVFERWWVPPFDLPYLMWGYDEALNLHIVEAQGRCRADGEVEYILVYDLRGREERLQAQKVTINS